MRVKLKDVAVEFKEKSSDKSISIGLEHLESNKITIDKYDTNGNNTFTKVFKRGQILFGRRRAYLHKAAVAPFDGICSGDIIVIEAIKNKIFPAFLPFVIQNEEFFNYAVEKSAGSLSPRVKWEHLKEYEFELPDFEEQKRLANILWKIEDVKNSINKTQKCLQNFFSYLSNNLFSTSSNMLELNKVVNFEKKSSYPASFGQENGLYKFYTSGSNITYCNEYIVDGKSIIVNDGGCALIRYNEGKMAYSDHTICLTEKNDKIKLEYIYYFLKSKEKFININLFKGSGLKNIDKKAFKLLKIPIIEQSEQDKIIEKLKTLDKLKKIMNNQYNYLTYVIKNILKEALNV